MKYAGWVVAGALAAGSIACAANQNTSTAAADVSAAIPDSVRLMQTIGVLAHDSLGGRATGTEGGLKAQRFLVAELQRRGVAPMAGSYLQPFRIAGRQGGDSIAAANVIGVVRGTKYPARHIVVSAHYDHLGTRDGLVFNGADDNASGTAGILEIASYFAAQPPEHSIVIALFDAEERGLRGAHHFVGSGITGQPGSILLNVNLDMVGRNDRNELYAAGTSRYPALLPYVQAAGARSGVVLRTGHDIEGTGSNDWTSQSDQGAFHAAGIPFLYFGVEDHPDYHQASDELSGIMPGFYISGIRTILDIVRQIDANPPS